MARKKAAAQTSLSEMARAIRQCVEQGKVEFGANAGIKSALSGRAKLIVVASNCPADVMQDVSRFCQLSGVPKLVFEGTSVELGTVAGRPHPVSVLAVFDAGNSNILSFAKA
ncbi:MAG: 50S ribosomal protein L30e [Candidatus Micrarchaeota archaeon]|nr:50S ribosomal protein L30e [Candidatus Micrarchaeota archaeon]